MNNKLSIKNTSASHIFLAAFSLLAAILIWVYVTDTQGAETDRTFPGVKVTFEGESFMRESRGLIVSDVSTSSARVTLHGSRRTISMLKAADLGLAVDLSDITRSGYYSRSPVVTYPTRTDVNSISTTETSPELIDFYVDILDKRTINIVGEFNGSVAEGYSVEPMVFSPSALVVYGPTKVLDSIDHAYIEVSRADVDKTLTFESTYVLMDADGNQIESEELSFDTDTVSVTLPVDTVKEVSLIVDLINGGGATDNNVKWELNPKKITLTGDSETLSGVNNIVVAKIDLATVEESLTETYEIVIPNNTEITSGPKEATLTLELGGLYTRAISIDRGNISCINSSNGYHWEIINDALEGVMLRSTDETALHAVSEVNVRAVADLTDYGNATGIVSVPVKFYIDGSTSVGVVGEYKVYVNITRANDTAETE